MSNQSGIKVVENIDDYHNYHEARYRPYARLDRLMRAFKYILTQLSLLNVRQSGRV